jgi:Leucine-rich repeat (LRR) protein
MTLLNRHLASMSGRERKPWRKRRKVESTSLLISECSVSRLVSSFLSSIDVVHLACACGPLVRASHVNLTFQQVVRYFDPRTSNWRLIGSSLVADQNQPNQDIPPLPPGILLRRLQLSHFQSVLILNNLNLERLEYMDASNESWVVDASKLCRCNNLYALDLSGCSQLTDVFALGNCSNLRTLDLSDCSQLTDVSALGSCSNLHLLDLSDCGQLTDVSALNSCSNLHTLDLSCCYQLTNVFSLASCDNLHTLNLSYCAQLTDVSALGSCGNLHTLNLSGCVQLDVSVLGSCSNLHTLNLSAFDQLTDVSALGS